MQITDKMLKEGAVAVITTSRLGDYERARIIFKVMLDAAEAEQSKPIPTEELRALRLRCAELARGDIMTAQLFEQFVLREDK